MIQTSKISKKGSEDYSTRVTEGEGSIRVRNDREPKIIVLQCRSTE